MELGCSSDHHTHISFMDRAGGSFFSRAEHICSRHCRCAPCMRSSACAVPCYLAVGVALLYTNGELRTKTIYSACLTAGGMSRRFAHVVGNMFVCQSSGCTHVCDSNCNQRVVCDPHTAICRLSKRVFPIEARCAPAERCAACQVGVEHREGLPSLVLRLF